MLKNLLTMAQQLVAVAVFLTPFAVWGYGRMEAAAQDFIEETVQGKFDALEQQTRDLTAAINRMARSQGVTAGLDEEQARISRQIVCLQELQIDPARGSVEECQNIE